MLALGVPMGVSVGVVIRLEERDGGEEEVLAELVELAYLELTELEDMLARLIVFRFSDRCCGVVLKFWGFRKGEVGSLREVSGGEGLMLAAI